MFLICPLGLFVVLSWTYYPELGYLTQVTNEVVSPAREWSVRFEKECRDVPVETEEVIMLLKSSSLSQWIFFM